MTPPRRSASGISLIEAVVALAVMAFGMLAYVGVQSSLRFNSDVAKQRSQAVRIAQEAIERWRAYRSVEDLAPPTTDYDDIKTILGQPVAAELGDNTTYTLVRTVPPPLAGPAAPRMKTLRVDVTWNDRNGDEQKVRLSTTIAASPPELAGTLTVPTGGGAQRQPPERNRSIPVLAKDLGNGTSGYKPPGGGAATTVIVFDNLTGVVVGVCNNVAIEQHLLKAADVQQCSNNANGLPLSGFVRFSTALVQPTAAHAEKPTDTALNLEVVLELTSAGHPNPTHACFSAPVSAQTTSTRVPYFCVVFFELGAVPLWSGVSKLTPRAFVDDPQAPWQVAADAGDFRQTHYRICRYTPAENDAQQVANQLHPRNYVDVGANQSLTNQDFLVIRAGNGLVPFHCPTDVPANPQAGDLVNSNTLPHQPPPAAP